MLCEVADMHALTNPEVSGLEFRPFTIYTVHTVSDDEILDAGEPFGENDGLLSKSCHPQQAQDHR